MVRYIDTSVLVAYYLPEPPSERTERGYVLYSTGADFARVPALRWVNPCGK